MRPGFVRIIAGKWRGRRLKIIDDSHLRPTPDRVRETVFNWLTPFLPGAHCLDAFAGSGAFGFEAVSLGAKKAILVDNAPASVAMLKEAQTLLKTDEVEIYCARLPTGLRPISKPFDIVFIDPPYQSDLLFSTCFYLHTHNYLAAKAYIYLEANELIEDNKLPENWQIIKANQAGAVFYHLALAQRITK